MPLQMPGLGPGRRGVADDLVERALAEAALDGTSDPTAAQNDDELSWCNDTNPDPAPPTGAAGLPGTPGGRNLVCP